MEREIRFRIWCKNKKEWERNRVYIGLNGDLYDRDNCIYLSPNKHILMQYTGLKDKNGKEVYEGDVVKCEWQNRTGVIDFTCGSFDLREGMFVTPLQKLVFNKWKLEVIGNIYDNPDLLEKQLPKEDINNG